MPFPVGKYEYDIVEVKENLPGVTYDTTIYDLVVEVTDIGGELKATYYYEDSTLQTVTFVNKYTVTPTEYTISGIKSLEGRAMSAGEFSFELYEGDTLLETVSNKVDGTFTFSTIKYTEAGEHVYTIKEKSGNAPGVTYTGVANPITVTVTVTDNDSILSAVADVANANIKFENSYKAAPATVTIDGTKTLVGATLNDNTFTFKLYQTDHTFDITSSKAKLVSTQKNVDGAFAFETIKYEDAGTYFYVVVEDATVDPVDDVVYDGTQHQFRVQVRDNGAGQLTVVVLNLNTGVATDSAASATVSAAFTNATFDEATEKEVYLEGNVDTEIDGQKVNAGDILTYYITYTNYTGEDVVADIMDTIPKHTSYVEGSASHNGTYAGTHLNWILNVAKGESVTVSFDVRVDETDAIVANTAIVRDGINTYTTNEVVNHTIDDPVEKDVFSEDDITTSIDGNRVYAGDTLVYTIDYTNASKEPVSVKITDNIPEHTAYVVGSADNGGVYADGKITWEIAEVEPWSTITVAFKVTVDANVGAETITNEANVVEGENSYTTNEVTNYTVEDEVEKKVYSAEDTTINIDGKKVYAGDTLVYTISYKNTAAEEATVTITDTIPQYTTYVDGSADNDGTYADGKLTWNLEVAAGETVTVTFKVTVNDVESVTITNKADIVEGKNSYTTNEVTNPVTKEDEPVTPPTTPSTDTPSTPKTGDDMAVGTWSALMFASIILCGALLVEKKRRVI